MSRSTLIFSFGFLMHSINCASAAVTLMTDQAAFDASAGPGLLNNDFNSLPTGEQPSNSLALLGGMPTISGSIFSQAIGGGDVLWVTAGNSLGTSIGGDSLVVSIPSGFTHFAANLFITDVVDAFAPGAVTVTFNEGSTFTISSTNLANSWAGFVSDTPLTSATFTRVGEANFVTIDDLRIGTPVPEASTLGLLLGLLLWPSRRRR